MSHALATTLASRRGLLLLSRNALAAFGLLAALVQLYTVLWEETYIGHGLLLGLIGLVSVSYGIWQAWPRRTVRRELGRPDCAVTVKVGDLFDQPTHLVIGFSDIFDTDTTNGVIIDPRSVQGQLLHREYQGDRNRLDAELDEVLRDVPHSEDLPTGAKAGKLRRFPIGTVATIGSYHRRFFCVAYSRMGTDLIAKSNVDYLWQSLSSVWDAIYLHGQRRPVSIGIIGAELARVNCLDRESLLKMILLSFIARSRQDVVCKELSVVVHPRDFDKINMLEVAAFMRTL